MDSFEAWTVVMGKRSASDVVNDFELVAEGVDEWVGTAAHAAAAQCGDAAESRALMEKLEPHFDGMAQALKAAIEE